MRSYDHLVLGLVLGRAPFRGCVAGVPAPRVAVRRAFRVLVVVRAVRADVSSEVLAAQLM